MSEGWLSWPGRLGAELTRAVAALPMTPAAFLQLFLREGREQLVGRRITVGTGPDATSLTLAELDGDFDTVGLAVGQLDHVHLVADQVLWRGTPLRRVVLDCAEVRVRSTPMPTVLTGSIAVEVVVAADVVRTRIAELRPDVVVDIGEDRVIRIRWAKYARWGHVEVTAKLVDGTIVLTPKLLVVGGARTTLVRRKAPLVLDVPDLPRNVRLSEVAIGPGELILRGTVDKWRASVPPTQVPELLRTLATAGATLVIPSVLNRSAD